MIVTTTAVIEGASVETYLGVVTGEAVAGTVFYKDWFAGLRDIVGGRAGTYQRVYRNMGREALADMCDAGQDLRADAIIGVHIDYGVITGEKRTLLTAIATGTAVRLRRRPEDA